MNSDLNKLHPYPFEKLARLKQGITPPQNKAHIALSIGEPKHPTPHIISKALSEHLPSLGQYPTTKGLQELRSTIAKWLSRRFLIPTGQIDPEHQVLPVSGTREALFSFAQSVIDRQQRPLVLMPNPFYQIYEGATLLAGAEPYYLNTLETSDYLPDFDTVPESVWRQCQLLYICSPGNPTGAVIPLSTLQKLIGLAEQYDFIIASDECYSEIFHDENNPPPGLLQAAWQCGHTDFKRCVVFHSLSKRSNAPGLRSGFVAGDADVLKKYLQYRTYQGCAMPLPAQQASIAGWRDENHVLANRVQYRNKFNAFLDILSPVCDCRQPPASFYVWLKTPVDDSEFARQLFARQNITVLPGSFLSRNAHGSNPGQYHVRIALVSTQKECVEAAYRLKDFINTLN